MQSHETNLCSYALRTNILSEPLWLCFVRNIVTFPVQQEIPLLSECMWLSVGGLFTETVYCLVSHHWKIQPKIAVVHPSAFPNLLAPKNYCLSAQHQRFQIGEEVVEFNKFFQLSKLICVKQDTFWKPNWQ